MDPYISEKEQIEQIRDWWRENRWFLLGGAAIVIVAYFGYDQYQARLDRFSEQSSMLYFELRQLVEDDDREGADRVLEQLASDYAGSPYLDQARMLVAEDNLIRDTDRAIAELSTIVAESDDDGMVRIASLRLARVLAYDEQYDSALAALDIPEPGEFAARFSEVRGDILSATGDIDGAINAYTEALIGGGAANQQLLQLKLEALVQERNAALEPMTEDATDVASDDDIADTAPAAEASESIGDDAAVVDTGSGEVVE